MEEPLGRQLAITGRIVRERFDAFLNQHDASLTTWVVLRSVEHEDGLSQRELAARISIESPTLVKHLDRLEAEGLVVRRRDDQDRRVTRVSLTDAGHRRFAELREVATHADAQLRSLLHDDEIAILEHALRRIRDQWHPDAVLAGT
jgi:MarR family transcriptional regulator for hemolysin